MFQVWTKKSQKPHQWNLLNYSVLQVLQPVGLLKPTNADNNKNPIKSLAKTCSLIFLNHRLRSHM